MSVATPVEQLEQAILKRAQDLANSHLLAAQQQKAQIVATSMKRQQLRENHETEIAKAAAEQQYRRKVQSSEIKMQAELDELRWSLIQTVISDLRKSLQQLIQQQDQYLSLLGHYLSTAAQNLQEDTIVVEVNAHDYEWLTPQWQQLTEKHQIKSAQLVSSADNFSGGMLVHDIQDKVRIDNTFEGLLERFEMHLCQEVNHHLFLSSNIVA
ncbi:MAG: V-type ATP synthase subunit E family protein [Thiotrichaceae bacterium]